MQNENLEANSEMAQIYLTLERMSNYYGEYVYGSNGTKKIA